MAEVLHRQAEDDVRIAGSPLNRVTTSSDGSVQGEGLHKIVVVGGGAAGSSSSPGSATVSAGAAGRASRWWNLPGHICGSRCCTKQRQAAWTPASTS
jgi:hypothetical protein